MTPEQALTVSNGNKTQAATLLGISRHALRRRLSARYDAAGSLKGYSVVYQPDRDEAFLEAIKRIAPKPLPRIKAPRRTLSDLLTAYVYGDPHIGLLTWDKETGKDFDLKIALADIYAATDEAVERSPASHTALICEMGDFFHAETDEQVTPRSKHKLDCDTRHAKIYEAGCLVFRRLVDRCLQKHARVIVAVVPGNHDPTTSRHLCVYLKGIYENNPRVQILDNYNPFIYYRHHGVLIGLTHGEIPVARLPKIMAADRKQDWGQTDTHVWFQGHLHHSASWEDGDCEGETFRTLAPRDAYLHGAGYRSKQAMTAITFNKYAEISRETVYVKR